MCTIKIKKLKNKDNHFGINAYQVSCLFDLPLYNMSSCHSMFKYLSLYGELCIFT